MNLNCGLADADVEGNLLAEPTPYNMNHDLTLTGGQRFEALSEHTQGPVVLAPGTIAREAELDCIEKLLVTKRLLKEFDGTAFHRLYRHLDVAMPCNEDDWKLPAGCDELALKIKAALTRQSHVEDQAGGAVRQLGREKFGHRPEQERVQAKRSQQTPYRASEVRVVVNDQDGRLCVRHRFGLS